MKYEQILKFPSVKAARQNVSFFAGAMDGASAKLVLRDKANPEGVSHKGIA